MLDSGVSGETVKNDPYDEIYKRVDLVYDKLCDMFCSRKEDPKKLLKNLNSTSKEALQSIIKFSFNMLAIHGKNYDMPANFDFNSIPLDAFPIELCALALWFYGPFMSERTRCMKRNDPPLSYESMETSDGFLIRFKQCNQWFGLRTITADLRFTPDNRAYPSQVEIKGITFDYQAATAIYNSQF